MFTITLFVGVRYSPEIDDILYSYPVAELEI